ncbi:unnamed protein product [Linum trigynum]|uniref:Uncharacterized protein n=1 Tax=Linum trigynum TaxID=586398 RepID=A0AAV2FPL6_9ROSI
MGLRGGGGVGQLRHGENPQLQIEDARVGSEPIVADIKSAARAAEHVIALEKSSATAGPSSSGRWLRWQRRWLRWRIGASPPTPLTPCFNF